MRGRRGCKGCLPVAGEGRPLADTLHMWDMSHVTSVTVMVKAGTGEWAEGGQPRMKQGEGHLWECDILTSQWWHWSCQLTMIWSYWAGVISLLSRQQLHASRALPVIMIDSYLTLIPLFLRLYNSWAVFVRHLHGIYDLGPSLWCDNKRPVKLEFILILTVIASLAKSPTMELVSSSVA